MVVPWEGFFEPGAVAIIGSLREGLFGGRVMIKTLQEAGFRGRIYPVNPSYTEVSGVPVWPTVAALPEKPDLALVMTGAVAVVPVMGELAQKGVRAVVVVSDGFAERDEEGKRRQEELLAVARRAGIRIIGPNTAGIANAANGFNPCPYEAGYARIKAGPVAVCSQTGMTNPQAYPYSDLGYGISKICDLGNKCDVDESDLLEYLANDPATGVISMYVEGIRDGRRFLAAARQTAGRKPVLVLKSGTTAAGARAAVSHTGSLAVDDRVFDAACRQAGIIRLAKFGDLFEIPRIFADQPLPRGNRLGIVSYTGGIGVLAADEAARYGLNMARLSAGAASLLDGIFPGLGQSPVDVGPLMAVLRGEGFAAVYRRILAAVLGDENVDCLVNVMWANPAEHGVEEIYGEIYESLRGECPKPLATWLYGPSPALTASLARRLAAAGFPVFGEMETAVRALGLAWRYSSFRREIG